MDTKNMFCMFRRKLRIEGIGNALLSAITVSASVLFIVSLIYHILVKEMPSFVWILSGILFVVILLVDYMVFHCPTKKRIAKRLDELGLQERIGTMLEFQNQQTELVKMQREDAKVHLSNVSPKQMKLRFSKRKIVICLISLCLATTMLLLPYDIFDFSDPTKLTDEERREIIEELIEELREKVEESELDEELKEELNDIIDKLEKELSETESELEQAAIMEEAKKEMEELLDKAAEENPEQKEAIEKLKEELSEMLEEKKEEILGNEKNEMVEEPEQSEEENSEEQSENDSQGEQPAQGEGQGMGDNPNGTGGEGNIMTEGIYDPIMGTVPYGEVFALYYAEYLEALEKGEVPEYLQKIMDQYYSSLE